MDFEIQRLFDSKRLQFLVRLVYRPTVWIQPRVNVSQLDDSFFKGSVNEVYESAFPFLHYKEIIVEQKEVVRQVGFLDRLHHRRANERPFVLPRLNVRQPDVGRQSFGLSSDEPDLPMRKVLFNRTETVFQFLRVHFAFQNVDNVVELFRHIKLQSKDPVGLIDRVFYFNERWKYRNELCLWVIL